MTDKSDFQKPTPVWPVIFVLIAVILYWMIWLSCLLFGCPDVGALGPLIISVFLITISGIIASIIYSRRIIKRIHFFRDKLFLSISLLFAASPLLSPIIGVTTIRFIRKLLYFLLFPNSITYSKFFLIFISIILFGVLMLLAYGIASWCEQNKKEKSRLLTIIILFFILLAVADKEIDHIRFDCTSDYGESECLRNRAIQKDGIRECGYFLAGQFSGSESNCVEQFAKQKQLKSEECDVLRNEFLRDTCVSSSAQTIGNADSCSKIKDEYQRDRCYFDTAISTRSINLCDKAYSKTFCKNRIYFDLALEKLSIDTCQNIDNSEGPYDSSFCREMVNVHKSKFDSAVQSGIPSECDKLMGRYDWLTSKLREDCKRNIINP